MSIQNLKELGEQILKAAESGQLQAEIALVSLENIYSMLSLSEEPAAQDDFGSSMAQSHQNMYMDQSQLGYNQNLSYQGFSFDEPVVPAVIGPQFNSDIISQASNIPFLFHQIPE